LLALDKAFTYDLPAELDAGVGSYVRFRFHGKLTKGWVLGPTSDLPARTLPVMRAVSEKVVPGGAANVAANLATLGVHVNLVGLCGKDEARTTTVAGPAFGTRNCV